MLLPWHDPEPLCHRNLGERYRRHLLHQDFRIVPLSDVPGLDDGRDLYLRCEAGSRVYPGVIVAAGSLALGVAAHPKLSLIPPATPCVVAPARDVEDEHRFVIVEGRVVSGARHLQGKHHRVSAEVPRAARDVADALQPQSAALGVAIDLRLPAEGEVQVAGDRDQVVQVVQNLVDNGLKHSPAGAVVRVEVAAAVAALPRQPARARHTLLVPDRSDGARYAVLRVSDDGAGMVRDELPRLTERFYRVGGQKSGPRAGTGLGLAIVRHIVNRHRGGLVVESAPGAGSAFTVTLPAA